MPLRANASARSVATAQLCSTAAAGRSGFTVAADTNVADRRAAQLDRLADLIDTHIDVEASVDTVDRTGVEMEALTAVTIAALTIYDMCKSTDRTMTIEDVALWEKSGGRSGTWRRGESATPDDSAER